jgi:hypothetical protein
MDTFIPTITREPASNVRWDSSTLRCRFRLAILPSSPTERFLGSTYWREPNPSENVRRNRMLNRINRICNGLHINEPGLDEIDLPPLSVT